MDFMARWIGPIVGLIVLLAVAGPARCARSRRGRSSDARRRRVRVGDVPAGGVPADRAGRSRRTSPTPAAEPRYPEGYIPRDNRAEQATFLKPIESPVVGGDRPLRADPPPVANRGEAMPIKGASSEAPGDKAAPRAARHELPAAMNSLPALFSMLGSLAVVLGLFLGLVWFMRRGLPKGTRLLSGEVVEVLGRAPLGGRQQMHVVRFGPKLVLIALSAGGAEALSEITDPAEVDRLAGICQQSHANSATNAFRQVFRQFGDDRPQGAPRTGPGKTMADLLTRKAAVPRVMEDDDDV